MDFMQAVESRPSRIVLRFGVDTRSAKARTEQDYVRYQSEGETFKGYLVDAYGKEWSDGTIQPALVIHRPDVNEYATIFCADSLAQAVVKALGDGLRKNNAGKFTAAGTEIQITLVKDEQFDGWSRRTWQVGTN